MFAAGARFFATPGTGFRTRLFAVLVLLTSSLCPVLAAGQPAAERRPAPDYGQREDVLAFIGDMVARHGFRRSELLDLFTRTRYQPGIIKAITPPTDAQAPTWPGYRQLFVNPDRIVAGARFRALHAETLARAEARFGVPAEIIVAIIGVETVYGRNVGRFRVIDALATLAFDYPPRSEFFRSELEQFLLISRDAGFDVLGVNGSYAGAIGIPQFMPGSYRRYAIDFDDDGKSDLAGSTADAIGSVANFLVQHGWARGEAVSVPARVAGEAPRELTQAGLKPSLRLGDVTALGISVEGVSSTLASPGVPPSPDTLVALIALKSGGPLPEYRVAFNNFYVLTRYNRSSLYASAVLELAQAIQAGQAGQAGQAR